MLDRRTIQCFVEEMPLVDEGFSLPATVPLNSYSWPEKNQTYIPYGILGVYPNSGPYTGNTDILLFSDYLDEGLNLRLTLGVVLDKQTDVSDISELHRYNKDISMNIMPQAWFEMLSEHKTNVL